MKIDVLTIFPDMFTSPFDEGIIKIAKEKGVLDINIRNIRDYTTDKHRTTDDYPYGGGAGMVMKPEPIMKAIDDAGKGYYKIILTPRGRKLTQDIVKMLSKKDKLMLICGRYEGIDERVSLLAADDEISIGDYVLSGGELGAMVLIDAVARLLPDVLGNKESVLDESFSDHLLEYPQYTRPVEFRGERVPDVLLSGNHRKIEEWRKEKAFEKTVLVRPDLVANYNIYVGLVHFPVYDKYGKIVATSITPIDVHDIARSSRSFGIKNYFIISPTPKQNSVIKEMLSFWEEGYGSRYNAKRKEALSLVNITESIEEAVSKIKMETGKTAEIWVTSAQFEGFDISSYEDAKAYLKENPEKPILLLFGTGWGLADDVVEDADRKLAPIKSAGSDYNHLSVRSAAAIIMDRLFGNGR